MISDAIKRAYSKLKSRNWDHLYFSIDIHDTIAEPNYSGVSTDFYEEAISALRYLSSLPEIKIILDSSCFESDQKTYIDLLKSYGINVHYFNENPEVSNTLTGCFDIKYYFDVQMDDKAGFDRKTDWKVVVDTVKESRDEYFKNC